MGDGGKQGGLVEGLRIVEAVHITENRNMFSPSRRVYSFTAQTNAHSLWWYSMHSVTTESPNSRTQTRECLSLNRSCKYSLLNTTVPKRARPYLSPKDTWRKEGKSDSHWIQLWYSLFSMLVQTTDRCHYGEKCCSPLRRLIQCSTIPAEEDLHYHSLVISLTRYLSTMDKAKAPVAQMNRFQRRAVYC